MAADGYSLKVVYIALEYVSIAIFLFILGYCAHRSINYLLQVFCVAAILNSINESFLLLHYYDLIISHAEGTAACTVSAIFEQYIPLVLSLLATCMGFNVWNLIVRKSKYTERQLLKWYCLFSFGIPFISGIVAILLLRNEPHWTAYPRRYYCDFKVSNITLGTYAIPMLVGALIGIVFTMHTAVYLLRHYFELRHYISRSTIFSGSMVIDLSHCIRLTVFSLAFGILVTMAILQRIVAGQQHDYTYDMSSSIAVTSDFSGSVIAFFLFLIFGTTQDAMRTLFLLLCPCWKRHRDRGIEQDMEAATGAISTPSGGDLTFEEMMMDRRTPAGNGSELGLALSPPVSHSSSLSMQRRAQEQAPSAAIS